MRAMSFPLVLTAIILLPLIISDEITQKLKSWTTISQFSLIENNNSNQTSFEGILQTNNSQIGTVELNLYQRSNVHNQKLKTSVIDCLFEGFIVNNNSNDNENSPVRLKYCSHESATVRELSGFIFLDNKVYNVHTNRDDGSLILFNADDVMEGTEEFRTCTADENRNKVITSEPKSFVTVPQDSGLSDEKQSKRMKRQTNYEQQERNFVEILVVNSYEYYEQYNFSEQMMIDRAVEMVHFADFYYALILGINLHLSLVDVITFKTPEDDPTLGTDDKIEVLSQFALYQWNNFNLWPHHDNAVLMINRDFTTDSSVIGLAYIGTLCEVVNSVSWVKDYSSYLPMAAGIFAHELGHNFGLSHNPDSSSDPCSCQTEACVMDATTSYMPPQQFTTCQQENIKSFLQTGSAICLHNDPAMTVDAPFCGDYMVNQDSEQCDCGSVDTCEDPCCHPENCTLKEGAVCSSMDLCCEPTTCAVKSSNEMCRNGTNSCDYSEYCDGVSAECPRDLYHRSGDECIAEGGAPGHCYLGNCRAVYSQCLEILEPEGLNTDTNEVCWALNTYGNEWGNCGSIARNDLTACSSANQRCGKLQCETDMRGSAVRRDNTGVYYVNVSSLGLICNSINFHFVSTDTWNDLAYVHDGTWCDDDSFCHNKECVHISQIPGLTNCPDNCFGRGDCNFATGQCECDQGYGGTNCEYTTTSAPTTSLTVAASMSTTGEPTTESSSEAIIESSTNAGAEETTTTGSIEKSEASSKCSNFAPVLFAIIIKYFSS